MTAMSTDCNTLVRHVRVYPSCPVVVEVSAMIGRAKLGAMRDSEDCETWAVGKKDLPTVFWRSSK